MTETKDNSSLPLLLSITGAVLAVAVGGWYLLYQDSSAPMADGIAPIAKLAELAPAAATSDENAALQGDETAAIVNESASLDVESELRKARLAANAEILITPPGQSALYYYGRVLKADPEHAIAVAELDAILARLAQTVTQHLAAEEYDEAYEIAVLVAPYRPEHDLVLQTQQVLDDYTEQLVADAIQHTQDGNDQLATEVLATAEVLPGRNPDYFSAVREAIADIQSVRLAAEQDRAQRAKLANDEARAAWVSIVREAVAAGNLISPAGASARDLLAEENSWDAERTLLTAEVQSALVETSQAEIEAGQLDAAETLLDAAGDLGADADKLEDLQATLDNAFIEAQSNRIAHMRELVQLESATPRYPRRAQERSVSGWVDVYFTVTASGETDEITVNQSEPKTTFDRAAIEAVEKWAFQPVEYRGQVINQRAAARLVFRLD